MHIRNNIGVLFFIAILSLQSCTTMRVAGPLPDSGISQPSVAGADLCPDVRSGVYHSLAPGETLWRVAQMYDVDVRTIKDVNNIANERDLEIGRRLYVPKAAGRKNVITLYPSRKWKYIIVHHSATDKGSSTEFNTAHLNKGWDNGVGYHFVIDNGTCGKDDGQIEISPRWTKQMNGAHCKAGEMNEKGIGVCVVGNFSEGKVSSRQMSSLVFLVKKLSTYYKIPNRNILGHGQVPGAKTECPGTRFPWKTFRNKL